MVRSGYRLPRTAGKRGRPRSRCRRAGSQPWVPLSCSLWYPPASRRQTGILIDRTVYARPKPMHPLFRADCSDAVDASGRRSSPPRGLRSIAAHPKSRRDQHARLRDLLEDALPAAAPATIQRLADGAAVGRLAPREPVCRQGEAVRLTLVLAGYVGHWHTTPDGRQMVLAIVRPGGITGHTAIARQSAIADTLAITPAEVAVWSGEDVRRLVAADPGLALDVVDVMARYILQFANRLDRFVHQDARPRV